MPTKMLYYEIGAFYLATPMGRKPERRRITENYIFFLIVNNVIVF